MSVSISSARRLAAGAVGASAVAGAMLFGVTHVAPVWWGHHHHSHRHGGIHIA